MIFGREPAFWIGTVVALVGAIVGVLVGQGLISDAMAGKVTDAATAVGQLLLLLLPVITGLLIRPVVTPAAAPTLPEGTTVTVTNPSPAVPDKTVTV